MVRCIDVFDFRSTLRINSKFSTYLRYLPTHTLYADTMSNALSRRLKLRIDTLVSKADEAKIIIEKVHGEGATEDELIKCCEMLKFSINNLNNDFHQCTNTGIDESLLDQATEVQIYAETLLSKINATLKSFKLLQKDSQNQPQTSNVTKLPTLEIKKYDGNISSFYEFWDRFDASINRRNLDDVDKMTYLVSSLEGPALEAIKGLEISNINYPIAVNSLKRLYGDKDVQIDVHYESLHKIRKTSYDAVQCRQTLNQIEQHLRVLKALGEDVDGNHLRKLIIDKFPDKIVYEINIIKSENNTVKNILEALETIITSMEKAKVSNDNHQEGPFSTQTLSVNNYNRGERKRRFGNNSKDEPAKSKFKRSCIFCGCDHFNDECDLSLKERKNKMAKRCYSCLREGHNIKNCRSKRLCYHCKNKHNRALCPKKCPMVSEKPKELLPIAPTPTMNE